MVDPAANGAAARAADIVKTFGVGATVVHALNGVTLELERGAFTAIMGPSGSGKSTLMHCMAGLDNVTNGHTFIDEVDLTTLDDEALTLLRRQRVGFIFQAFNLVPTLNARENIVLPLSIAGRKPDDAWLGEVV